MDEEKENPFKYHTESDLLGETDPKLLKKLGIFPSDELGRTMGEVRKSLSHFF
ncbi:hypothetical protein JW758_00820 [Candidatus Peregrinibacteria bacterium]|nr:hypothetical protein [Candidatus Peregrinibacteria bacterium]